MQKVDKLGVAGRNVNPSVCPFKYIKISGQVYQRNTGNIYDDEYDYKGVYCHDCGVLYDNTHHIQCDMERCSKCEKQLLGCGHLIGVKFHRGPAERKKTLTYLSTNLLLKGSDIVQAK